MKIEANVLSLCCNDFLRNNNEVTTDEFYATTAVDISIKIKINKMLLELIQHPSTEAFYRGIKLG